MSPLLDLMTLGPPLNIQQTKHLRRLVSWWTLLADLSFSDLLLFLRSSKDDEDGEMPRFVIADQIRASTGRTLYRDDYVGAQVNGQERPFVAAAFAQGRIQTGEVRLVHTRTQAHVTSIPVLCGGKVIAALSREVAPELVETLGEGNLERNYLQTFAALADMVAAGDFPYPAPALPFGKGRHGLDPEHDELSRVGDGMLLVGDDDMVTFASPNAVSALHRVGVTGDIEGKRLDQIGLAEEELSLPRPKAAPVATEITRYDAAVQVTALPLRNAGSEFPMRDQTRLGALMLLRDVTALRQRDLLLLSKDRTIAEIHHRVKNNLQTISSLLRIQARRLSSDEASRALQESIRRIAAIALVHEALSTEATDDVDFCGVARVLADTMRHSLTSQEQPIDFVVRCSVGKVPTEIVTPLAVVLNELLQNAVDHAYPQAWVSAGADDADGVDDASAGGTVAGNPSDGDVAAGDSPTADPTTDDTAEAFSAVSGATAEMLGTVEVDIERPRPDLLRMVVRDDGVGLPEDFDINKTLGLGTSIVRALTTADLSGMITYKNRQPGSGTVVLVEVPLELAVNNAATSPA